MKTKLEECLVYKREIEQLTRLMNETVATPELKEMYRVKRQVLTGLTTDLENRIDLMAPQERLLLRAKYFEDKTIEEIARILHYTERHIYNLINAVFLKLADSERNEAAI